MTMSTPGSFSDAPSSFSDDTVISFSFSHDAWLEHARSDRCPDPEIVPESTLIEEARWHAIEQRENAAAGIEEKVPLEQAAALRKEVRFVEEEQEDQPAAAASLHPSLMFLCFNVFWSFVLFSVAPSTPHHPMLGAVRGVE